MEMEEEGDNVAGPSREISGQEAGMSAGRAQGAPALPSGWSTPNSELEVMAAPRSVGTQGVVHSMSAGRAQGAPAIPSGWSTPNSEVLWVELEVMAAKPQRTKAVLPVHGSQECGHTGRGPLRRLSRARQSTPHLKVASTKKEREELW